MKTIMHTLKASATLLLFHALLMAGTTGKISGRITDGATGEALPGANVSLQGTTLGAATDVEGDYFIVNIQPGVYSLSVSVIGYRILTITDVRVTIDHTTTAHAALSQAAVELGGIDVVAEVEVIKMDESSSVINANNAEIMQVPSVKNLSEYMALQAGIFDDEIRGGDLDQTALMVDGLVMVDNRSNTPIMAVNLSSIKEANIIMGGFNAEYGNVRSGLLNVITKDGEQTYHGSADFRYIPAQLKHPGASVLSPKNYRLKVYMDPAVAFGGTEASDWTYYDKLQNLVWNGWNAAAADLQSDFPGITAQDMQDIFIYQHAMEGSANLKQKERKYGDQGDVVYDLSLGGPIPVIGGMLGDMTFFLSHRTSSEQFAFPTSRPDYRETNTQLKLTSQITPTMRLSVEATIGEINSVNTSSSGASRSDNNYERGPGNFGAATNPRMYWDKTWTLFDVKRNLFGLGFDHSLSPRTFYNVRISYVNVANYNGLWLNEADLRDMSVEVWDYSGFTLGLEPYGFFGQPPYYSLGDGSDMQARGGGAQDSGYVNTTNIKFDLTSQVNKYNQLKVGFEYVIDDLNTLYRHNRFESPHENRYTQWSESPRRLGGYLQDKLEFEGMVANVGLRLDWNNPNTKWFDIDDPYANIYTREGKAALEDGRTIAAKGHLKISPRIGITHPISEVAKLYFNYGHFYSMPTSQSLYRLDYGRNSAGMSAIGNPEALWPRTTAYELGIDFNAMNMFRVRFGGYYKDVADQTGNVGYENFTGAVNYTTTENNNYEDIRGLEIRIDKSFGRWITGWFNYDYMVQTSGFIGRRDYYEDPNRMILEGLQAPEQNIPLARPRANAYLALNTPRDFGPMIAGQAILGQISASLVWSWRTGSYFTWDPLGTDELTDNQQNKSAHNVNVRLQKRAQFGGQGLTLFVDINNILNLETLQNRSFDNSNRSDRDRYRWSLHLAQYADPDNDYSEYWIEVDPTTGVETLVYPIGYSGDLDVSGRKAVKFEDEMGDFGGPGTDKPYIDMPNRLYLYDRPRYIEMGIQFDF